MNTPKLERQFVAFFWFVSWDCISLGLHLCYTGPHFEIHLPFGFIKIGWSVIDVNNEPYNHKQLVKERVTGFVEKYKTT
jgi:hypothetical protein